MSEIKIKLVPFQTPNFISQEMPPGRREDGFKEGPKWPLAQVDADTLSAMCDEFRAEVFHKAGKPESEN